MGATLTGATLRGSNLSKANLTDAVLKGANLSGANLIHAILSEANLTEAVFRRVNLRGAILIYAILSAANFSGADLSGADLSGADLSGADLSDANLTDANLGDCRCSRTIFANLDLFEVRGLDSTKHLGPSTVGNDTLFRSKGKISDAFLRGCGVPEGWIEYLPSLIGMLEPIQFYSCFISYSTENQDFAAHLYGKMRDKGLRTWFAPKDAKAGKKLHEQIYEAIRVYDKLLLVLSRESMGSEWVKTEIREARKAEVKEGQRKLFPIRLVDFNTIREWEFFDEYTRKDLGIEISEYFIPDFSKWKDHDAFESSFAKLLKDLKAEESIGSKHD